MPEVAIPPVATPSPAPAPAPHPSPAPVGSGGTPMDRARARMAEQSFEADPSDPHPERTIKQKKSPAPAPEPKKDIEPPKPVEAPAGELDLEEGTPPPEPKPGEEPPTTEKPPKEPLLDEKGKPIDKTKVSPWKLVDRFKERALTAEKESLDLKERLSKIPNLEESLKRIETVEARNKELEEEIKYQNYSKSKEYQENHEKPLQAAWGKAIKDLSQLDVMDEAGAVIRKATADDLLNLARMPLGEARKTATAMFGDSVNDVMMHRKDIIALSEKQQEALDNARKAGTDREQQWSAQQQAITKEIITLYEQSKAVAASKLEYLKPKEGDEEWNGALTKAQTLVDTAFNQSSYDPRLSPEQRAKLVKSHAAIRNRAIAYSAQKIEINRLRSELAKRDEKLKQYESSEPTAGNGSREAAQDTPAATPMARAMQRMQKQAVAAPPNFY